MAGIPRLRTTRELKTDRFLRVLKGENRPAIFHYDPELDTLMLLVVSPENETVVHPINDMIGLLYDPGTLEVVGVQVEDFESSFMAAHEPIRAQWRLNSLEPAPQDVGDLIVMTQEREPRIAREVVRVTAGVLAEVGPG